MFEAVLKNTTVFKNILDAAKDLISHGPFYFTEKSVCLEAMNQSQVAVALIKLEAEFFETYRCDCPIILGINIADLYKIFKCSKPEESCTIKFVAESKFLTFIFENNKCRQQEASLNVFQRNYEHLLIPEQIYSCVIDMPAMEFQKICKDIALFSDTIIINASFSEVAFKGSGNFATYKISYVRENKNKYKEDD